MLSVSLVMSVRPSASYNWAPTGAALHEGYCNMYMYVYMCVCMCIYMKASHLIFYFSIKLFYKNKGKDKDHPRTSHEGPEGD
jgi:heme/copper-type cytochrome/quinol oxidase subunit 2